MTRYVWSAGRLAFWQRNYRFFFSDRWSPRITLFAALSQRSTRNGLNGFFVTSSPPTDADLSLGVADILESNQATPRCRRVPRG
jgi:hypothetical protein